MQKLVDLKAMAYRFLVVPVAGVLGLGGYGEEGKRERRRRGTRSGAHPLQRGVVVTGFCRDGEDGALRHGELLEPVLLGITGMCAGGKGYFRDSQTRSLPIVSLYFCVKLP